MDFSNKNVLITGGSRGIGKAIAIAFAKQGARVAIVFHSNRSAADATVKELNGSGHIALQADVANPVEVEQAVNSVIAEFGTLDIAVNNAGIGITHPLSTTAF